MKAPPAPRIDERRTPEFLAEMEERARAWIPSWGLSDGEHDFGRALLEIAARFNSEVSERLDGVGEKMRRGFLDWLAVKGEAARPARPSATGARSPVGRAQLRSRRVARGARAKAPRSLTGDGQAPRRLASLRRFASPG